MVMVFSYNSDGQQDANQFSEQIEDANMNEITGENVITSSVAVYYGDSVNDDEDDDDE